MSTLMFGDFDGVPLDEARVRATTAPVETDAPPAESDGPPEASEVETDRNPNLGGLSTRQLASDWHESVQYPPGQFAGLATAEHNAIIDRQVSTSGTAAARELAGQYGHGTLAWAHGIEPTITGLEYGNEYFAADRPDEQELSATDERGVQPTPGGDRDTIAGIAAYGNVAARDARDNMSAFYAGLMGGR